MSQARTRTPLCLAVQTWGYRRQIGRRLIYHQGASCKAREWCARGPQASRAQRKPRFPVELSGVLELRAATR